MGTSEIRLASVELAEGRVRYFESGTGPTLLLLHGAGFLSGGDSWLPAVPGLAEYFRVIAPDFLGWGASDQPEYPSTFGSMVDQVREFQDLLGIAPCYVVGHSMGGRVATLLAYESPNRVPRVVLVAPGGAVLNPVAPGPGRWPAPSDDDVRRFASGLEGLGVDVPTLLEERLRLAHDPVRVERFRATMNELMTPGSLAHFNTVRFLPYLDTPTLLLWGSADRVNPLHMGELMHAHLPDSQLVVFDGAGHGLPTEITSEFNAEIVKFLM